MYVITPPSGRGLVIPVFFIIFHFFVVTCPRPPVFAWPNKLVFFFATQAIVASFATQARACILSDHNIFYTPSGGGNGGVMPLGLFLFFLFLKGLHEVLGMPKFEDLVKPLAP